MKAASPIARGRLFSDVKGRRKEADKDAMNDGPLRFSLIDREQADAPDAEPARGLPDHHLRE
uniref:hypothetical protein n=1 Tax=Burkholderia anthina TaxID=179879 RepID=UPI00158C85D7|nr:hypothetical protein [Burkholderia anthina]